MRFKITKDEVKKEELLKTEMYCGNCELGFVDEVVPLDGIDECCPVCHRLLWIKKENAYLHADTDPRF